MQPKQFLVGQRTAADAPLPTVSGFLINMLTGVALLWLLPHLLPVATPRMIRFWIALVGHWLPGARRAVRLLGADLPGDGLSGREALGLPDRRDEPRRLLGPALEPHRSRRCCGRSSSDPWRAGPARIALLAVFLYSGMYHEILSFMTRSGYGGPTLYFLVQYLGVAIENSRPARRWLRGHPWLGRGWTWAVVILPVGLVVQPSLVEGYLIPLLVKARVPGLEG